MYDANGNLVVDLNKNVKDLSGVAGNGIRYNHLDKPEEIHISGKGTIRLVYDADGNKLQRTYTPEGSTNTKVTTYINQYVYEGDALQYINFEEGRIRLLQPVAQDNGYDALAINGSMDLPNGKRGAVDYYIRDYQQNVRMIVTEEVHFSSGTATMETGRASVEEPVFGQAGAANEVSQTRFAVSSIPGQSTGQGWQNSSIGGSVSRLSRLTGKIGPNSLLKVMAGDELSATTQYFYQHPAVNQTGATPLTEVLQSLLQAIMGSSATSTLTKASGTNITSQLSGNSLLPSKVAPDASAVDNIPKSYLTVLFFDERFNFVNEGSASIRVSAAGNSNANLTLAGIKAPKNGYAYIYVSNESDEPVYYDNFRVSHNRGRIVEEDHYYAFGLKIAGISSRKLADVNEGNVDNKYLYNDKELFDDGDLNWQDYGFRNYDVQIGRLYVVKTI